MHLFIQVSYSTFGYQYKYANSLTSKLLREKTLIPLIHIYFIIQDDGSGLRLSRKPVVQYLGNTSLTGVYQNQDYKYIHETCDRLVSSEYVQAVSYMR